MYDPITVDTLNDLDTLNDFDTLNDLDTPSMIVGLDLMEDNIKRLFSTLLPTGLNIRPHLKTTKSAALAHNSSLRE
jgi:D-serine deaminase-like pyridoxal phosphate-dependent protein